MTMKLLLPKQHGAWAMLTIPFWLGVMASGFRTGHLLLFAGWFFLYLATYPALMLAKRKKIEFYRNWTLLYGGLALLFLLLPVIQQPKLSIFGVVFLPFFAVSAYYSAKNQDRALLNDLSAIVVFSLAGVASSFYSESRLDAGGLFAALMSFLFFLGSTFYVKTMIREKNNLTYRNISWVYHSLIVLLWLLLREWVVCLAFLPSLIRAIALYGKKISILKVGISETANALIFFAIAAIAMFQYF
jgi:hypothetical protein